MLELLIAITLVIIVDALVELYYRLTTTRD